MFGRHAFMVGLGVIAAGAAAAAAWAQGGAGNYPDHPIRVIVSVPAGGGVDTVTRLVAAKMQVILGQPMVVENRAGVGGSIAAEYVFGSPPDGYTLLASQPSPITTNPLLYKSLSYDPAQLVPIAIMSHVPNVVLVRKDFPAKTIQELIAYAKANPGKINFASQGIGTTSHTTAELFQKITGTKMTHVPYHGAAPAFIDLIPGRIDCYFGSGELLTYSRSGQVRALATTGAERSAAEPDLPTIAEAGVPGYAVDSWQGVFLPAKTPADIITRMSTDITTVLAVPAIKDKLAQTAYAAQGSSPQALRQWLEADSAKWSAVIKTADIKID